jgi:O-antigen ligase
MIASFAWSDFPGLTLVSLRSEFIPMTLFGLYGAVRFDLKDQIKLTTWALGIGSALSVMVALAMPSVGFHAASEYGGALRGIYGHKNTTSGYMVLMLIGFLAIVVAKRQWRLTGWIGAIFSIALILMTTSKTGLAVSVMSAITLLLYRNFKWKGESTIVISSLSILVFTSAMAFIIGNLEAIAEGLGRDLTLTGRVPLWNAAINELQQQLWFGFGRDAFWNPLSEHTWSVHREIGQRLPIFGHSHNGFLDLAIDIGLIGFSLFLFSLIRSYIRTLKLVYSSKTPENLWVFVFLNFLVMNNVTESYLTWNLNLYWVLYVMIALSVGVKQARENLISSREVPEITLNLSIKTASESS